MYSTIILLLFLAFLLLYNLSKKSRWTHKPALAIRMEGNLIGSRVISISLITLAGLFLIFRNGIGAGLFSLLVMQMAIASLIVLLFPFRYLSVRHVLFAYLLFALLETIIC